MALMEKHCVPCEGNIPAMAAADEDVFIKQVKDWQLIREGIHKIRKEFTFKDFKAAVEFVNKAAIIAEAEGHHPDIYIYFNKVVLELFTHAVKGLFENDFIMAAKMDDILSKKAGNRSGESIAGWRARAKNRAINLLILKIFMDYLL
jgi:4a-hydroxytetrahydrobiopterin dehydratase